jgi:MFS family permease
LYGWIVLAGCTALSVLSGAFFYSRGIFLPKLAHDHGVGRLQISLAFTCAQAVGGLAAPVVGGLMDRRSPRAVLALGAVMLASGYVLTSISTSLWTLYVSIGILSGLGWLVIGNFGSSKILVEWFRRRLGLALSVDVLGASAAGVIIAPVAAELIARIGWRSAYAAIGVFTAVGALLLIAFVLRSRPPKPPGSGRNPAACVEAPDPETVWTSRRLLGSPRFWSLTLVFGAMNCVWSGLNLHLYGHLTQIGLPPMQAAQVLSIEAGLALLAKPFVGAFADSVGPRTAIALALGLQLIGVALFAGGHGFVAAAAAAVIFGTGLSGLVSLQNLGVARIFGRNSYGAASGLVKFTMLPIVLIASPLAGLMYDLLGSYRAAFWCYVGLLAAAAPVILMLRFDTAPPAPVPTLRPETIDA